MRSVCWAGCICPGQASSVLACVKKHASATHSGWWAQLASMQSGTQRCNPCGAHGASHCAPVAGMLAYAGLAGNSHAHSNAATPVKQINHIRPAVHCWRGGAAPAAASPPLRLTLRMVFFISASPAGLMPHRSATRIMRKRCLPSSLGVTSG